MPFSEHQILPSATSARGFGRPPFFQPWKKGGQNADRFQTHGKPIIAAAGLVPIGKGETRRQTIPVAAVIYEA